jgi:hypothetical protein
MDARADLLSHLIENIQVTDMSNGTVTFKYNHNVNIITPSIWGISQEIITDVLSYGSLKLLAEAMIFPVEIDIFVYDEKRQEAKGTYST